MSATLSAQSLKVRDTTINGKKYFIYPYEIEEHISNQSDFIPPVLDSLPNGDYVLLAKFFGDKKKKRSFKYNKAFFTIQKNILEGHCFFYYPKGTLHEDIQHHNGKIDGALKKYYSSGHLQANIPYVDGKITGTEINYFDNTAEKIQSKIVYDRNMPSYVERYGLNAGKTYLKEQYYIANHTEEYDGVADHVKSFYKRYFSNGQIAVDCFLKESVSLYDLRRLEIPESNELGFNITHNSKWFSYSFTKLNLYYSNGQKVINFRKEAEDAVLVFDTIFNVNGSPFIIRNVLSDTLNRKHFSELTLLNDGNKILQFFIISNDFRYLLKSYSATSQKWTINEINNTPFQHILGDEIIPEIYLKSKSENMGHYRCTGLDNIDFKRGKSDDGYDLDFEVISNKENWYYKIIVSKGDLKMLGHFYFDSSHCGLFNGKLTRSQRSEGYMATGTLMRDMLPFDFLAGADSINVFYKELPFNGKIISQFGNRIDMQIQANKIVFTAKKIEPRNIDFVIPYKLVLKDTKYILNYGENSVKKAIVKNGKIQEINIYSVHKGRKLYAHYNFENGLLDGQYYIKDKMPFKPFRYFEKGSYAKGLLNGELSKWFVSKEQKYHLSESNNYNLGVKVGAQKRFGPESEILENYFTDERGLQHGMQISYIRNGGFNYANYYHGDVKGFCYSLSFNGDTTSYSNYSNNMLNGEYMSIEGNSMVKCYVVNDLFKGRLLLCDTSGITRLIMDIDSSYYNWTGTFSEDLYKAHSVKFYDQLMVKAHVKVYTSWGELYAEGQRDVKHDTVQVIRKNGTVSLRSNYFPIKTAEWTYYNPNKIKVNYSNVNLGAETFMEYYANGQLKYVGTYRGETHLADCSSDLDELHFDVIYKYYLSEKGDTIVNNGYGKVKTFYNNGALKSEGEIQNGLEKGWWKYYSKDGNLNEVGQFIDAQKTGRWLEGDLYGINYLEDKCFESEEIKKAEQEADKNKITITETIYEKGITLSNNYYHFTRSK